MLSWNYNLEKKFLCGKEQVWNIVNYLKGWEAVMIPTELNFDLLWLNIWIEETKTRNCSSGTRRAIYNFCAHGNLALEHILPEEPLPSGYSYYFHSLTTRVRSHSLLVFPTCLKVGRETTLRSNIVNSQRTQIEIELSLAVQPGTKAGLNKHSVGQKSITWVRNKNLQQSQF